MGLGCQLGIPPPGGQAVIYVSSIKQLIEGMKLPLDESSGESK
jgi:hypothetical protein